MGPRCTHVAIFARDIDKAVSFYRTYADLHECHRRVDDGVTVVWLAEPGRDSEFVIVLIGVPHADPVDPAPLAHIGYAVESREQVDAVADRARREACLVDEPRDAGPVVGYYCILRDPDGNLVEFSHGQSLQPVG
jgi:catechol 2,3-dioxygenase-like lactoylglutathione lyase family enzyme